MRRDTGSAWLPRVAMDAVATRLSMPPIRVYEVATFYLMFNTKPVGRHHLQVCTTTPCWLRGSDDIVAACKAEAGLRAFEETSADGLFTMTEVECLGACANAPILQVNDDYYEDLDFERTRSLIAALRRGETSGTRPHNRPLQLGAGRRTHHIAGRGRHATCRRPTRHPAGRGVRGRTSC